MGLFFIFRPCEPLARVNADCPAGRSRRSEAQARPALGGADAASGSGLLGLKDRAEAIGGTIALHSPRGAGTSLRVELPIGDHNDESRPAV